MEENAWSQGVPYGLLISLDCVGECGGVSILEVLSFNKCVVSV